MLVRIRFNAMEDQDAKELRQFGYQPQLRRSLGHFSSLALPFSIFSGFTGVFARFEHGLRQTSGALVWSRRAVLAVMPFRNSGAKKFLDPL
jgi:hypothetical protein